MEYLESIFFLIILLVYASTLKASTFFIVFGSTIYLFIISQLLYLDPFEILSSFLQDLLRNPFGFLLLFVPLGIDGLFRVLKFIITTRHLE
jgi:hypothetical protein